MFATLSIDLGFSAYEMIVVAAVGTVKIQPSGFECIVRANFLAFLMKHPRVIGCAGFQFDKSEHF